MTETIINEEEFPTIAENTMYKPYECATVVNAWLESQGYNKQLPPQMFYTYTKKGTIPTMIVEGVKYVELPELEKWYVAYVRKNLLNKKSAITIPQAPSVA